MMKRSLSIVFLLFVAGCAASSVRDIKENYTGKEVFTVARNYQAVYRDIQRAARECWEGGYLFSPQAQNVVTAELYNELEFGEISLALSNVGMSYYVHLEIRKANDAAEVTAYYSQSYEKSHSEVVAWANGGTECDNIRKR